MDTVFDPTMLFINDGAWQNPATRDAFLQHLLNNLTIVDEHNITRYYWSDYLENLLWNAPTAPPWRQERDWSNKLVPIIYRLFIHRTRMLDSTFAFLPPASHAPLITDSCPKSEYVVAFGSLMHWLLVRNEDCFLCLGVPNSNTESIVFSCGCHSATYLPTLIRIPQDWRTHIDIANSLWPRDDSSPEQKRLRNALSLTIERHFPNFPATAQSFRIEPCFLDSLVRENALRENILYAISKRLLMTQQEASSDAGIEDEPVRGQDGMRRFRVSCSARIHYTYGSGEITLQQYFPPGCHEDGL